MNGNKTNNSLDSATIEMLSNTTIMTVLPIVYSLVVLISIPGNLFSFWVLFFHTKPKTPSIIFMINLTMTDIALACCLPFQITYHINRNNWSFGPKLCSLLTVMFYANMYSSIITMTYISLDRYMGVVHPLKSKPWKRKRYAILGCITMWLLVLIALHPLAKTDLTYKVKELNITTCFDVLQWSMLPGWEAWACFLLVPFICFFLIPFVVTVACYIGIIRKLIQTSHRYGNGQKTRSVYLAVIVVLVFIICFAPNNFILLVHMICRLRNQMGYYSVYKLTLCLSCLNNCIDPFIYYFASKDFYQKFKELMGQKVLLNDSSECRRESVFSGRTVSVRTMSSGHVEGVDSFQPCLQRHESVF